MIDIKTIEQIQRAPVADRIHLIEVILQSLKDELDVPVKVPPPQNKRFQIRQFDLGCEVHVDRDILYSERVA